MVISFVVFIGKCIWYDKGMFNTKCVAYVRRMQMCYLAYHGCRLHLKMGKRKSRIGRLPKYYDKHLGVTCHLGSSQEKFEDCKHSIWVCYVIVPILTHRCATVTTASYTIFLSYKKCQILIVFWLSL